MPLLARLFLLITLGLLYAGCAAPGSAMGRHAIRGTVVDARGQGVAGQRVEIILPASYGMGGLDTYFGNPEDYGHHDRHVTLTTDRAGSFSHVFDPSIYHITFFLLPPIGAIPRLPPKPFYGVRLGSRTYIVGIDRGHFDYRVVPPSGPPQRDSSPRITGSYTLREATTLKGWETTLTITR